MEVSGRAASGIVDGDDYEASVAERMRRWDTEGDIRRRSEWGSIFVVLAAVRSICWKFVQSVLTAVTELGDVLEAMS